MTVFVDTMRAEVGRMVMCHMWADTRGELLAMADRIGVDRRWFQRPATVGGPGMDASWEHFDICVAKRQLAVSHGAQITDRYGALQYRAQLDGNRVLLATIAARRAGRAAA